MYAGWNILLNTFGFYICLKYVYTLAAVGVCISRVTTPVTCTGLFITGGAIQTMTATVVHTVVTKGSAITLCNRLIQG